MILDDNHYTLQDAESEKFYVFYKKKKKLFNIRINYILLKETQNYKLK
jgi:hypothetical protein